jgi:hypothetical protein
MSLPLWKKLFVAGVILGSAFGIVSGPTLLAQKPEAKPAASAEKKPRQALPAHFGDLVDKAQREKIYAVQNKYSTQLAALADQIKDLESKRDAEIEAVLTAEQKAKLEKARADAKAKAAERTAAKKAAAEAKPTGDKPAEVKPTTTTVKPAK